MNHHPITVIIPCKNEEHNVRECVASAKLIADEIIVADSGSTDATMQIARENGCRVIARKLVNFGNFKNWAIPQAKNEWVFIIDADERITPQLADEIKQTLSGDVSKNGFWVARKNHFMGHPVRFGGWGRDRVIRLFRRELGRYVEYTDHTEVQMASAELGSFKNRMIHYTCWNYDQFLRKMDRYTEQQADQWLASGRKPSRFKLITTGPLRFMRDYVFHGGILDGVVGFQIAALTGFYSFLKQAKFWQKYHGKRPVTSHAAKKAA